MAGLLDSKTQRQPYTPERIIVSLLYFKCCAPKASDYELAKVLSTATGHKLHNETVKALLERYFFWRYEEFRKNITYPALSGQENLRLEMLKLKGEGWSEKTIAHLLKCSRNRVSKWLRRAKSQTQEKLNQQPSLFDNKRAPKNPKRVSK